MVNSRTKTWKLRDHTLSDELGHGMWGVDQVPLSSASALSSKQCEEWNERTNSELESGAGGVPSKPRVQDMTRVLRSPESLFYAFPPMQFQGHRPPRGISAMVNISHSSKVEKRENVPQLACSKARTHRLRCNLSPQEGCTSAGP